MEIKKVVGAILIILIAVSLTIFIISFTKDFDEKCKLDDFEDWQEMEMDGICGDFGFMHIKLLLVGMGHAVILALVLIACSAEKEEEDVQGL